MKFITSTFARSAAGEREDADLIPLPAELIAMFSGVSTGTQIGAVTLLTSSAFGSQIGCGLDKLVLSAVEGRGRLNANSKIALD
jgi:hypothetical protein